MRPPKRFAGFLWLLPPTMVCVVLLLGSIPSLLISKKVIGLLVLPSGVIWLGLMAMIGLPGLNRWGRAFAALVLVVYRVAGNAWAGAWLLGGLESPYAAMTRPAQPFDAICVLGGGSSATPNGDAQLGPAGDRLIVPARLFLSGKAGHLVASGLSVTDIGGSRSLADDTAACGWSSGFRKPRSPVYQDRAPPLRRSGPTRNSSPRIPGIAWAFVPPHGTCAGWGKSAGAKASK